ncbi:MAG: SRPBCC family protein [Bacteroidota bacterium]
MKTKIDKVFQVNEPVDKVWDLISDPQKVVVCVPGASITEAMDDRNYKGTVSLKFGPVKAVYNGEIAITDMDTAGKTMTLVGKGLDSKGKGSADMEMQGTVKAVDGGAEVDYSMEVSVTGMLAQFGSRLITDVSNSLFDQFVTNFQAQLAATDAPAPEAATEAAPQSNAAAKEDNSVNAFAIMWAVIKGFFARLFGRAS